MTIRRAIGAAALVVSLTAAAPADWGNLSHWAGRYPTDSDVRPPARLFDIPAIRAEMEQLLSSADRNRLRALSVETPIEQIGPFVIIKQCMPHDCGNQNAIVVLDGAARRMWVGLFARTPAVTSTRWFGTDDFHALPSEVLRSFDQQHEPQ
jgi:hypothetical protein